MAQAGEFPLYEIKPVSSKGRPNKDIDKYVYRIHAKNRLSDIARKMAKDGIPDQTKYHLGALMASSDAQSLYMHRIFEVRHEARHAHLALGFLRGKSYVTMENKSYDYPDWVRIQELVTKYGDGDPRVLLQRFAQWKQEGEKRGLILEPGPGGWDEAEKRGVDPSRPV